MHPHTYMRVSPTNRKTFIDLCNSHVLISVARENTKRFGCMDRAFIIKSRLDCQWEPSLVLFLLSLGNCDNQLKHVLAYVLDEDKVPEKVHKFPEVHASSVQWKSRGCPGFTCLDALPKQLSSSLLPKLTSFTRGFLQNSTVTEIDLGREYIATKIIKVLYGFKGIHISKTKNLVIWHYKKLLFLFYLLTLQNIQ